MALNASKVQGGSKTRVEQKAIDPGAYPARLVQIIDMGLQPQRAYQGKDKPPAQMIRLTYELVDTFMVDDSGVELTDKPRWLSEELPLFSLKADKAKSTQRYNALDPTNQFGGDFTQTLNTPINVTVVHNESQGKTYENVALIAPMRPKDAERCPELVNKPVVFDLDSPDLGVFTAFPEWIQEKIKGNLNYQGSALQKLLGGKPAPTKAAESDTPAEEGADGNNPY